MVKIETLHPAIRSMAQTLLDLGKKEGIDLRITFGGRTFEEQQELYDKGRKTPGDIVTKAKPGQSFHNYFLAIDVCPFVNGKPDWNSKLWSKIGQLGESVGFEWGGRWQFVDKPHFQFPIKTSYRALLALKNSGKVDKQGYVILPS